MQKLQEKLFKIIPKEHLFPPVFAFAFNMLVYLGTRVIAGDWHHYNIESPMDRMIPFLPPFAFVYLGCYVFWIVNYILIARLDKKSVCRFFAADFLSRVVCMVIYLAFPTTNIRPQVDDGSFWGQVMTFLYSIDAADNLFPSIHCLVSWFCYIGLRGRKEVPRWYRGASCFIAVLVFISTLTTKQHVIIDVAGGVLLAEVCYAIGKRPKVWKTYEKFLDKVNGFIFRKDWSS